MVGTLSDLSNLALREAWDPAIRLSYRDAVSKLFYMHYDFLPKAVLNELILLHVALDHPESGPYMIENNTIVPMGETQIVPFIEGCSIFRNVAFIAPLALKSNNPNVKGNQVVKLHTRHVLYTLNQFSSIDDLLNMAENLKKGRSLMSPVPTKKWWR